MHKVLILLLTVLVFVVVVFLPEANPRPEAGTAPLAEIFADLPAEPLEETLPPTKSVVVASQPSQSDADEGPSGISNAQSAQDVEPPADGGSTSQTLDDNSETPDVQNIEPETAPEPLNEEEITQAVVRIRCGKIYGSGFVRDINGKKYAFTAAHVVINKITAKDYSCNVIFPRKNSTHGFYEEAHYRAGKILAPAETETNFKVRGLDFAILEILPLDDASEDQRIFPNGYPAVNYPFCPANTLNDKVILWGYAVNISSRGITYGDILSRFEGQIISYANATGVEEENFLPKLDYVKDISVLHPYTVIVSANNFAGASGGLVFNVAKRCVVGNNTATSFDQNMVFGLIANPNYESIRSTLMPVFIYPAQGSISHRFLQSIF